MRKTLLFLICTLFTTLLFGQIELTKDNFPQKSGSFTRFDATNAKFDWTKTGPNFTWDFSTLTSDSSVTIVTHPTSDGGTIVNFQFGYYAPDKYQADYYEKYDALPLDLLSQFGNVLPVKIDEINRLVKVYDDKITYPGYVLKVNGQQIGFRSTKVETGYEFPLKYGDSYSSDAFTDFDFSIVIDAQIKQYRHRTSTVDGYGKLIVPYTAVYNVIRIHHHITESDSLRVNIAGTDIKFKIPRTMDVYEWRGKEMNHPIVKVETETVLGNTFTKKVTFYRRPVPHGTKIFPNPAIGQFKIQSDEGLDKIIIFDVEGRKVKEQSIFSPETIVPIPNLAGGRYTVQTISEKGVNYYPLLVQ